MKEKYLTCIQKWSWKCEHAHGGQKIISSSKVKREKFLFFLWTANANNCWNVHGKKMWTLLFIYLCKWIAYFKYKLNESMTLFWCLIKNWRIFYFILECIKWRKFQKVFKLFIKYMRSQISSVFFLFWEKFWISLFCRKCA